MVSGERPAGVKGWGGVEQPEGVDTDAEATTQSLHEKARGAGENVGLRSEEEEEKHAQKRLVG